MEITRDVISAARPAGEVRLGSISYANCYGVDPIMQVREEYFNACKF